MRYLLVFLIIFFSAPVMAAQEYICPMHPHIQGEEGDHCPICGMSLVAIKGTERLHDSSSSHSNNTATLNINPAFIQALGVKTSEVKHHTLGNNIRAYGRVVPNTRTEKRMDVRTEGWITELETDAVGDPVKKGDLLFTFYSPDLVISESDFLLQAKGKKVFGNPELRLRLEGMDDTAISQLKEKGELIYEVPFHAPTDGTVSVLNVRKGSFVKAGETILVINDFSTVWVNADIPIKDMPFLKVGDKAVVTLPDIGHEFPATVDFIHPVLNAESRTGIIRLVLENNDSLLHPDHYVDVEFFVESKPRLAIPKEAVLYSKDGAYVFEAIGGGRFNPIMVETGITTQGLTEIKSGLMHGQKIVTSGQFLLDAETNLKGGMATMGHDHGK